MSGVISVSPRWSGKQISLFHHAKKVQLNHRHAWADPSMYSHGSVRRNSCERTKFSIEAKALKRSKDTGLLQCITGGTSSYWGHAVLEGQKTPVPEYYSSVSFTQVLIIPMSPSVCSRRFFMGCIEVKVSSHTGCMWGRTGLKVWCSRLTLGRNWDHYQHLSGSDFILHQHIMAWKKTTLKEFLCAISFAFWVG